MTILSAARAEARDLPPSPGQPLPDEAAREALAAWWGRCLSGQETPPPVRYTPEFEALIDKLDRSQGREPSEAGRWPLRLCEACSRDHPGEVVVWMETPAGPAIIAAGEDQIDLFYKRIRDRFGSKAHFEYPFDS